MKCPHCKGEHPDDFKFCPVTGAKLEPQLKACTNKDCPDYGKAILPAEAKFCPRCGSPIEGVEEDTGVSANSLDYAQMLDVLKQIIASNNTNNNISSKEDNFVIKNQGLFTANGVNFKMIAVQGGAYTMGVADNDPKAYDWEKPAHKETVSDFMIGETPVTQELWKAVMGSNPSYFAGDMQRPVDSVSWFDCQTFIRKLNQLTGQNFRLPSEAEWEYAARGGNRSKGYKYAGSNDVDAVACYGGNSGSTTHPVKNKRPNELGIYDMSGNVCEWCQDEWCRDYNSPRSGSRVLRGGSWGSDARSVRVSDRGNYGPDYWLNNFGLRLAL